MCLSTVYRDRIGDENLLLSNVQRIECHGSTVVLTDIMERQMTIEGTVLLADLVENKVIIAPVEH